MSSVPLKKYSGFELTMEYGHVLSEKAETYEVRTEMGRATARVAASCFLRPVPGDRVIVSVDDRGEAFILAVLERAAPESPQKIDLKGPVHLHVEAGGLHLTADEALTLAAKDKMTLAAPEFELDAHSGRANVDHMSFVGRFFQARIQRVKYLAESMDAIFQRLVSRSRTSYRYVSEHDEHQTASTRMLVDGSLSMHTETTMHTAKGHIKMDAEQIHLA